MRRELPTILKWLGNLLLLGAAYVLVCSLFLPSGVQVFNRAVCPDGGSIDNQRLPTLAQRRDDDDVPLELACVLPEVATDATKRVGLLVLTFVIASGTCFFLRHRLVRPRFRAPEIPSHR